MDWRFHASLAGSVALPPFPEPTGKGGSAKSWRCDLTEGMVYAGSPSLREQIVQIRPSLHITGHIHEAYGTDRIGQTVVGNASCVNARYELVNKPLLFSLSEGITQQLIY